MARADAASLAWARRSWSLLILLLATSACVEVSPWRVREWPWDEDVVADAEQVRVRLNDGREERLERPELIGFGPEAVLRGRVRGEDGRWQETNIPMTEIQHLETRSIGAFEAMVAEFLGTVVFVAAIAFGAFWLLTDGEFRFE